MVVLRSVNAKLLCQGFKRILVVNDRRPEHLFSESEQVQSDCFLGHVVVVRVNYLEHVRVLRIKHREEALLVDHILNQLDVITREGTRRMIQELSLVDGYDRQKAVSLFDGFKFLVLGNLRGKRLTHIEKLRERIRYQLTRGGIDHRTSHLVYLWRPSLVDKGTLGILQE